MDRIEQYIEVLRLDNFLQVLTWQERLQVNQYRAGRTDEIPPKAATLQGIIQSNGWDIPEFRYSEFRELKWVDNGIPRALEAFEMPIIYELKNII